MTDPRYPSLYEINTRVWLRGLSGKLGRAAILDDVPDAILDSIAHLGFDWLWLMGVWQIGPAGRQVSLAQPEWRKEYEKVLPDVAPDDIGGSPYAVQAYTADVSLGGDAALARFRQRLQQRGMRLMLDFVPNHTALDHAWVKEHPEYYVQGSEDDLQREPKNYCRLQTHHGTVIFAYGRDPYLPGWPDTLQLNYRHMELREARKEELTAIADRCDGLRCDMAMLLLPEVFQRTWGEKAKPRDGSQAVDEPFWPEGIALVHKHHPDFLFLAEVYWDLEWTLQQEGFNYTYDKRLYDRLKVKDAGAVRGHLHAEMAFQEHCARFPENHDEERAAAVFPAEVHQAAAVLTYLSPGMRFFHGGQLEGWKAKVPVHLTRRPAEAADPVLAGFYRKLLDCLRQPAVRNGCWRLLDCRTVWPGNPTWLFFIAFLWEGPERQRLLVVVNYGPAKGQCFVQLPLDDLKGRQFLLRDLLSPARYDRSGDEIAERGLFVEQPGWGFNVFQLIGS
jgi:hypothetical protein